jgi:hypothetical protein
VALPAHMHTAHWQSFTTSCVCWTSDQDATQSHALLAMHIHSAHVCGAIVVVGVPNRALFSSAAARSGRGVHVLSAMATPSLTLFPQSALRDCLLCLFVCWYVMSFEIASHLPSLSAHATTVLVSELSHTDTPINTPINTACSICQQLEHTTLARHGTDRHAPPRVSSLPRASSTVHRDLTSPMDGRAPTIAETEMSSATVRPVTQQPKASDTCVGPPLFDNSDVIVNNALC